MLASGLIEVGLHTCCSVLRSLIFTLARCQKGHFQTKGFNVRIKPALRCSAAREKERVNVCYAAGGIDEDGSDNGHAKNVQIYSALPSVHKEQHREDSNA